MALIIGCSPKNKLPKEKYYQFDYTANYFYNNDTLKIELKNPLNCPLRISITSPDSSLHDIVNKFATVTLKEKTDTAITYYLKVKKGFTLEFNSLLGDLNKAIIKEKMSLPFPKNRTYTIIQGYNGSYSHHDNNSRAAIDFDLKINDTICSAANGYVVGVIEGYQLAGETEEWLDYCNLITIYHPGSGLFTQYVHLVKNGSFVKVGDTVTRGQPIGLSGMTGYTSVPHLHFNVKKPDAKEGLLSTGIEFEEGYTGSQLTKNTTVKK
jgi:murein DD-endopeptidase MepM/ murein hydrolase activator NlpD